MLNLFLTQFPCPEYEDLNSTYLTELLGGLNELLHEKHLEQCLPRSERCMCICCYCYYYKNNKNSYYFTKHTVHVRGSAITISLSFPVFKIGKLLTAHWSEPLVR